jgi:Glycerophosphoryl diester phosphodiesterase family
MNVLTHRGLNSSANFAFPESSLESFEYHLEKGFGIEFDLQITKDNHVVVSHDSNLIRISEGKDKRNISDLNLTDVLSLSFNGHKICTLKQVINAINKMQKPGVLSAIHFKHGIQNQKSIDSIYECIRELDTKKYIIFDVTLETASYLKNKNKNIQLAPSISHPYDISRYGACVGNTLMSIDVVADLFDWAWLDEWDTKDKVGSKRLYTQETFKQLRALGLNIALVTPELHSQSPGLLGSEKHSDAENKDVLFDRIKQILSLKPNMLCTDYPEEVIKFMK